MRKGYSKQRKPVPWPGCCDICSRLVVFNGGAYFPLFIINESYLMFAKHLALFSVLFLSTAHWIWESSTYKYMRQAGSIFTPILQIRKQGICLRNRASNGHSGTRAQWPRCPGQRWVQLSMMALLYQASGTVWTECLETCLPEVSTLEMDHSIHLKCI